MSGTPRTDARLHASKEDLSAPQPTTPITSPSRRKFLGKLGAATVAAGVIGSAPKALASLNPVNRIGPNLTVQQSNRVQAAFNLRAKQNVADALSPVPPHTANGDEQLYSDKSASYSKGLLQNDICVVNPAAWVSFKTALNNPTANNWNAIIIGGTRTQNGPQGSYAFDLEGLDSSQYGNAASPSDPTGAILVPPFDAVASASYGTQLIELYWASLLRDVAFTDYGASSVAASAAAELTAQTTYRGPRDGSGNVTTDLLFRGPFPGQTLGPYMSQLMITPTSMGQQAISQTFTTYQSGLDYMLDQTTFLDVQNGIGTGLKNVNDLTPRYLHDWRGLGAWTHTDVLYQGYFAALLVMGTLAMPANPGSPYAGNRTQNGFCTFGGPDIAASLGEIAARALQKVWYQKWLVHLTHRPEIGGGLVWTILTGQQNKVKATLNSNILNSQAVAQAFATNHSYFLSQPFPEGSPTHPSYPTGHGTVGGACITLLKFFYDENYVFTNPMQPSSDGLSLVPYTGGDTLTLGGELNKLAYNVSFGHGVGAGIHWRMDTDNSMLLGEAMAISYLQDKAKTYNEKFSITLTKLDGNKVTISN